MSKDENCKNKEKQATDDRERLANLSRDNDEENINQNVAEKTIDEEFKKKELPEDDKSDTDTFEEGNKLEKSDGKNKDINGSSVRIFQSLDLKPKHLGLTRTLLLAMFAALIGTGAQFGYALGVMNAPSELIKSYINEIYIKRYNSTISPYHQDKLYSTAISVVALGGMFGGLSAIPLSNRLGRLQQNRFNRVSQLNHMGSA
ncbi:unnamed protein product [Rotaria magnacalcarata]|uniref:Uncharacterized protein n=1 Tax=Rotaria magnacalcarata TaxID=392030 RepID=A0A8S2VMQ9_9BILA|nr:unnamed protein product [Rotaria magnacalcarata]